MGVPAVSNCPTGVLLTYINLVGVSAVCSGPMDLSTPSVSGWSSIAPTVAYINFLGVTVTCYVPLGRYDSPTVAYNTY